MTWKFKKAKDYETRKIHSKIEQELIPEAFERNLFIDDAPVI